MGFKTSPYILIRRIILLILMIFLFWTCPLPAGEMDRQRIWAGLELFPSMLAADKNIHEKKANDNRLIVLLIYRDRKTDAEDMAGYLKRLGTVKKITLSIEVVTYEKLTTYQGNPIGGLFLTQRPSEYLKNVIIFGKNHHTLVFSPFVGDVEQGVQGGILISDIIKPYINISALSHAQIVLKPFYLNAAERYEP